MELQRSLIDRGRFFSYGPQLHTSMKIINLEIQFCKRRINREQPSDYLVLPFSLIAPRQSPYTVYTVHQPPAS